MRGQILWPMALAWLFYFPAGAGAQFPSTQEPPLADGPGATMPAVPRQLPLGPAVPAVGRDIADPPTPIVSVRIRVPSTAASGKDLEYHIFVENSSRATAHHVLLRVPMPASAKFKSAKPEAQTDPKSGNLSWALNSLEGGVRREIVLVLEPTGDDDIVCCARVSFEHGECVRTKMAKPALQVRRTGPTRSALHDVIQCGLEVMNSGLADANDIVITEELPAGLEFLDSKAPTAGNNPLTWKIGNLRAGQARRIDYQLISQKAGKFDLKATASAAGGLRQENLAQVVVDPPLQLVMTGPRKRTANRTSARPLTATYWLTVTNAGALPVANVMLSDKLSYDESLRSRIEFLGASDGGRLVGTDVRWFLGTIEPGGHRSVSLTLRPLLAGTFVNVATAAADTSRSERVSTTTEFERPVRALTIDVEKSVDPGSVKKPTTLTFHVNQHIGSSAGTVLAVTIPDGLQVVDARGATTSKQEGSTVRFAPLATLDAGAEAVFVVTLQGATPGKYKVRAVAETAPIPAEGPVECDEEFTLLAD